ncbi:MAG: CvpA family protein [Leptolyngbya sp. PLA3]|nr:CvpA family protein [Leptolyngbya sp. PL-A3]
MIFNLLTLGLVALIAYMWSIKGFFSSFLHMLCVFVAGAVAFGLWEPVSILLLNWAPQKGMLASVAGNAWGLGLALPFVIVLLLSRIAMDKIAPANVQQTTLGDYIGGGVCGAVTGIITMGILVISLGSLRFSNSTMGMGYMPINYTKERATGGGSLVYDGRLLVPVDKLTGMLYSHLSLAAFSSSEPLAKWHPDPSIEGPAARITYDDGNAKNFLKPGEVTLKGVYIVGSPDGSTPADQILVDAFSPGAQRYVDVHGDTVGQGMLLGVKFELSANAKESTGQHMIAPGQLRLLVQPVDASGNWTGEVSRNIFPVALISQADGADATSWGRWRFEAEGVFVSSVGGGSSAMMAAEFFVPPGVRPLALYIKNLRVPLDPITEETQRFAAPGMRDAQIRSGTLLESIKIDELDKSKSVELSDEDIGARGARGSVVTVSARLGNEAFQTSQKRELTLDGKKQIVSGHGAFTPAEVSRSRDISNELKVDRFAVPDGTVMVQIDVSPKSVASLLGPVGSEADQNDPFYIIDTSGTPYQAVGYVYKDRDRYDIHYFPGNPLRGMVDLRDVPGLTAVRDDQEMRLLFLVSRGVEMQAYAIGSNVVFELEEPRKIEDR